MFVKLDIIVRDYKHKLAPTNFSIPFKDWKLRLGNWIDLGLDFDLTRDQINFYLTLLIQIWSWISIKSALDIIEKLKMDWKEIEFVRIQSQKIKNDKIYQLLWLISTFLMDFDFFNLLINIKVIFLKSFNWKEIKIV